MGATKALPVWKGEQPWDVHLKKGTSVDDVIGEVAERKDLWLDLSGQGLSRLPESLFALTHLRGLRLAGNALRELPREISALESLEYLDLSANRLRSVSPRIQSMGSLEYLDL